MSMRWPAVLGFVTLASSVGEGQQQRLPKAWLFGIEAGLNTEPSAYYSRTWFGTNEPSCASVNSTYLGMAVGRRVSNSFHVDAMVSIQAPANGCTFTTAAPVPPYIESQYIGDTPGYEYAATTLRGVLNPGSSLVRPRGVLGVGLIPAKKVPQLSLGAGVSAGKKRTRFVSELGVLFPRVKWTLRHREYSESAPVREFTETGTSTERQLYGRIGVEF